MSGLLTHCYIPLKDHSIVKCVHLCAKQLTPTMQFLNVRCLFSEAVSDFKVYNSATNKNKGIE